MFTVSAKITFIAEAGVNHDGSYEKAIALVDAAADAGADTIKFQTFSAAALVTRDAALADYQRAQLGSGLSQYEMLLKLELSRDDHHGLLAHCAKRKIEFLSTPFDLASLAFLVEELGARRLKIGSGDLSNGPLLYAAAQSGCELLLSTGMAHLGQIELALGLVALGLGKAPPPAPTRDDMLQAWADPEMRARLAGRVTLLHCVSNYPASAASTNLRAMGTLRQAFGLPVGYSDHTLGPTAAILSVAMGATCIEKHLTLDKRAAGPDHAASSEPAEMAETIRAVREASAIMGGAVKACTAEERSTAQVARKSVVAAQAIAAGEAFGAANLTTKRKGSGIDAMAYWEVLGRQSLRAYAEGDAIDG